MTAMGLSPDQIKQAYSDLKRMIYKIVHCFQRKHGGDFHEILSEAHVHFMKACQNYEPERGCKLITVVHHYVRNGLKQMLKRPKMVRSAPSNIQRADIPLERLPIRQKQRGLVQLREELSEDAQAVIRLALAVNGTRLKLKRRQIVDFLCDYGWAASEVVRSFKEIREVM